MTTNWIFRTFSWKGWFSCEEANYWTIINKFYLFPCILREGWGGGSLTWWRFRHRNPWRRWRFVFHFFLFPEIIRYSWKYTLKFACESFFWIVYSIFSICLFMNESFVLQLKTSLGWCICDKELCFTVFKSSQFERSKRVRFYHGLFWEIFCI